MRISRSANALLFSSFALPLLWCSILVVLFWKVPQLLSSLFEANDTTEAAVNARARTHRQSQTQTRAQAHLLGCQVTLLLGQKLIAHHELLDGGRAQQRRIVVRMKLPVALVLVQVRPRRSS